MAKRDSIDSIYRQSEAAGKTAKKKAGKTTHRQDGKTFKTTHYITEAAQALLEGERHERRMAGKREGSDFSSLVDEAVKRTFGKRGDFDAAADAFTERMKRNKKRGAK